MIENYGNGNFIGRCDMCGASHYVEVADIDPAHRDEIDDGYDMRKPEDEEEAVYSLRTIGWERDISGAILCEVCAMEADNFWRGLPCSPAVEKVLSEAFKRGDAETQEPPFFKEAK